MKQILTLLLAFSLIIALSACSNNKTKKEDGNSTNNGSTNTTDIGGSITTPPESTNDEATTALENRLKGYLSLCDNIGEFENSDEISGISFFFAVKYDVGHIKKEEYYHDYDENHEFPHPIYTYDITQFDSYSLQLFDTTFEYAAIENIQHPFYEYTYNGEAQLLIEKVTGFGGGPDDITFNIVYDGYEYTEGKYVASAHYTAENLMGDTWETDITATMTVEDVEGAFKIRSFVVNGSFIDVVDPNA